MRLNTIDRGSALKNIKCFLAAIIYCSRGRAACRTGLYIDLIFLMLKPVFAGKK
jgi:hypothetical protein